MKPITLVSGALLGAVLLAQPAVAQKSEAQARSDIAFARGLASKWQFVDLAEKVMLDLERAGVGKAVGEELGLVKCDIYAEGAKKESDAEARDELYTKAVDAYKAYIDQNPFSDYLPQAERSYVDICNAYGRNLERRYADAVGEEAIAVRNRLHEVLEEALKRTGDLIAALVSIDPDDRTVAQSLELARVRFNRGQMLHSIAKVSDEGAFFFSQAEQVLEDLALEVGEKTPQGLFAFLELSRVHASQGHWAEAADFAQFVVDAVIPIDEAARAEGGWNDLTPDEKGKRWLFVEWGIEPLTEAYVQQGDAEEACRWALHFYNTWKREGFTLSRPSGYLALLASARTLLSAGGHVGGSLTGGDLRWFESDDAVRAAEQSSRNRRTSTDLALSIAQNVNQDNRGNTLQIHAQKLISDVIDRPGVAVAPDVLFEAAQGEYFNKDYLVAIDSFKRVMRSLDAQDEATRQEYGAKVLYHLAESHRKLERPLEAAMAYREGVTAWRGDPEFDDKNARGFYGSIADVRRNLKGVKEIDDLWSEAESVLVDVQEGGAGDVVFRQAKRAYDQGDYPAAREKFLEVEQRADAYEKALTYAALCLHKLKDLDAAEAEFQAYLTFMRDPKNAIIGSRKEAARNEATAMASFYLGKIAFDHANKGKVAFDVVVQRLADYTDRFPGQTSYGPNALYMVMMSHLALMQLEDVKKVHAKMVELYPTNKFTGSGALKVYKVLKTNREALEEGSDAWKDLSRELAVFMRLGNELDENPTFTNLRAESRHWYEIEAWEEAERVLRSILKRFGTDPKEAENMELYVKPDLGDVLLKRHKVPEAFEVLAPLVPDPDDETDTRKPSSEVVLNYCRSISGWLEDQDGTLTAVPGVAGEENLTVACRYLNQLQQSAARDQKWECPWYEAYFDMAYGYYQWGAADSARKDSAQRQIETLRTELGEDLRGIGDACGDDRLRKRFQWLWGKVR